LNMVQVVTRENMAELVENRKVADYQAPEEPKKAVEAPEAPPEDAAKAPEEDSGLEPGDAEYTEKVRKRIGQKHSQWKREEALRIAAEKTAEEEYSLRRVAEGLLTKQEAELEALRQQAPKEEVKAPSKPDAKDFSDAFQYAEALAKWSSDEAIANYRQKEIEQREKAEAERVKNEFSQRIAATMKQIPDYESVVAEADAIVPPHVAQYIVESESGPLLGYHFAKNPAELERISKLSPIRAIAEIGKIEAALAKPEGNGAEKPRSRAPEPIVSIPANATPIQKDPAQMSTAEYIAYARARDAQRRH
jgi:hypothetical protein